MLLSLGLPSFRTSLLEHIYNDSMEDRLACC